MHTRQRLVSALGVVAWEDMPEVAFAAGCCLTCTQCEAFFHIDCNVDMCNCNASQAWEGQACHIMKCTHVKAAEAHALWSLTRPHTRAIQPALECPSQAWIRDTGAGTRGGVWHASKVNAKSMRMPQHAKKRLVRWRFMRARTKAGAWSGSRPACASGADVIGVPNQR